MIAYAETLLTTLQLEQALEVSEKDVKDASAGVLKDLKRFQGQKEEDLRRYMVSDCSLLPPYSTAPVLADAYTIRLHMPNATSTGRKRTWRRGGRLRRRLARSTRDE